jgi:hypothetical protein
MPFNAAVGGTVTVTVLDLLLKMNMSRVRVAGVVAGAAGPSTAAHLALDTVATRFRSASMHMAFTTATQIVCCAKNPKNILARWWHDLQLNVAEYTAPFALLMVRL